MTTRTFEVKITNGGGWELHRAGCSDVHKGRPVNTWTLQGADPKETLAHDIMQNYGFDGMTDENGETHPDLDSVISRYEGRVMPCCK